MRCLSIRQTSFVMKISLKNPGRYAQQNNASKSSDETGMTKKEKMISFEKIPSCFYPDEQKVQHSFYIKSFSI